MLEFRRSICALSAVAAMIGVAACGGDNANSGGSTSLNIRIPEDPGELDPQVAQTTVGLQVANYLYDTLVAQTANGRTVPALATKWDVTPTSLTLTIRDDVTCSDGSKMTPSVIKANLDRVKDPKTKSPYTDTFLGSSDYTVTANDAAGTVTMKLPQPFAPLLANLSRYPAMMCEAALRNPKALQDSSVGSGPFVLKEKVADDHYTLTPRKGYKWGPDGAATAVAGFPKEVTLRVVPNDTTAANQLESGELDLAPITGAERERLEQSSSLVSKSVPTGVTMLHFNEADGRPGADPAVRKALVQAFDRQAMTQAGYGDFAEVTSTVLIPGATCYSEEPGSSIPAYDAEAAKGVLSGAAPSVALYALGVKGGEYLSEAWNQAGARTEINVGDETGPGLDTVFGGGDWDAALIRWDGVTSISIMQPYLSGPAPPDGTNVGSIDNPTFVDNADTSKSTLGGEACAASDAAQNSLYGASDVVPISAVTLGYFAKKGVEFALRAGGSAAIAPTSLRTAG
jgi:peptide/nickel transport system substrate-binding protein